MDFFQSSVLSWAHPLLLRPLIFLDDCGKGEGVGRTVELLMATIGTWFLPA